MPPPLQTVRRAATSVVRSQGDNRYKASSSRCFSASSCLETRQRRIMYSWLRTAGASFVNPLPNSTNYLGAYSEKGELRRGKKILKKRSEEAVNEEQEMDEDGNLKEESIQDLRPFPLNRYFSAPKVVNEEMREHIWSKIMEDGQSVQSVSARLGVEMGRVGAIVRLKEVEKQWVRSGKTLATPYAKAVMGMLPKTSFPQGKGFSKPHESINDLPVHSATIHQIFHPTSESRKFTRSDAAKVFADDLLPADDRVPHPELTLLEKDRLAGMSMQERKKASDGREKKWMEAKKKADERRAEREAKSVKMVSGRRWDFRFQEVSVDDIGADGRGHRGTGWRYGVPHNDRTRGAVKIPTSVE